VIILLHILLLESVMKGFCASAISMPTFTHLLSFLLFLNRFIPLTIATPSRDKGVALRYPTPEPALLPKIPIVDALLALGASPPPTVLRTPVKSPVCAAVNQGELMCCRATVAGDVQLVVWLAMVYGYDLNPNDINGLGCKFSCKRYFEGL
jgi:hypothetical protein